MQLLRKIAFPFSLLYGLVVYLRNLCYDKGIFKSNSFKTPIVCIGNLSVGGTGKTPMIAFLLNIFKGDYKVAVLSRGYRRKTKGFLLATKNSTVAELGDEPFQLYSKYKNITLAVDANRSNGIKNLENLVKPELIFLDDAFQHRKVKPSIAILLTTFSKPYFNDCYLPTGDLRDSKKEAHRAALIIVTKCPDSITKRDKERIISLINPKKYQKVLFSKLAYDNHLIGVDKKIPLTDLDKKPFSLVTGIANPEPLVAYLKSIHLSFKHFEFPDHYFFKESDIAKFSKNEIIITTEKDFAKLKGIAKNVFYLGVKHDFFDDGELELRKAIKSILIKPQGHF